MPMKPHMAGSRGRRRWEARSLPSGSPRRDTVSVTADTVIISTGASDNWLELPSVETYRNKGISACATCDGFFFRGKKVAVVGGGDSAVEEATFLTRFATEVHLLVRRDTL